MGNSLWKKGKIKSVELANKIFRHIEHVQKACDTYEEIVKLTSDTD